MHSLEKEALVIIDHEKTNWILSKQSAFDCNFTTTKTIDELYEINIKGKLKYAWILPKDIIEKLRQWVKVARQVENWIKELV
jgi:nicotinic acid mononucleotide adenylyltransferase